MTFIHFTKQRIVNFKTYILSKGIKKLKNFVFNADVLSKVAQAQDVNELFNSDTQRPTDTVTQRTIYRDCMGN